METDTVTLLLKEFTRRGYQDVRVNIWRGCRIYVNIKGETPFWFNLKRRFSKNGGSKVECIKELRGGLFEEARKIGRFVWINKEKLLDEMQEGVYYTR